MVPASGNYRRAQRPVSDDPESRRRIVLTKQRHPVDRERRKTERGKPLPQHRQHALAPLAPEAVRSTSCGSEILPSRKDSPSGRDIRAAAVSASTDCGARDPPRVSGARNESNARDAIGGELPSSSADGSAGITAMKPLIESTTGLMTGMGRGVAAKASQAASSSASVLPAPARSAPSAWHESRICGDPASARANPAIACVTPSGKGRSPPP